MNTISDMVGTIRFLVEAYGRDCVDRREPDSNIAAKRILETVGYGVVGIADLIEQKDKKVDDDIRQHLLNVLEDIKPHIKTYRYAQLYQQLNSTYFRYDHANGRGVLYLADHSRSIKRTLEEVLRALEVTGYITQADVNTEMQIQRTGYGMPTFQKD